MGKMGKEKTRGDPFYSSSPNIGANIAEVEWLCSGCIAGIHFGRIYQYVYITVWTSLLKFIENK